MTDHRTPSANGIGPGEAIDAAFDVGFLHRLRFTRNVLDPANPVLAGCLHRPDDARARIVVFIDDGVARAWPDLAERLIAYAHDRADAIELAGPPEVVVGGERSKNDWSVYESVAQCISDRGICRQSYVVAIGGGAMLDAVGFAAATAHRGVRLVRVPTTTLAQGDAAIGVKNGINAFGKKNFLGAFAPPWAIINDEDFLATLADRDWRAGGAEAVKVALVKDAAFFDRIVEAAPRLARRDTAALRPVLRFCAELHLRHIVDGGDPFELTEARPLDFGHWSAHRLEQLTDFRLRHGEAVAIGLAIDVLYSARIGLLDPAAAERIIGCLETLGFELAHDALADPAPILDGLEEFREHLGGRLTIALLEDVGRPIDVHEIDRGVMSEAIGELDRRCETASRRTG